MKMIERLERAQEQTWWLPEKVVIHEGPDHCFYGHGGEFRIIRFTPSAADLTARLNQILQVVGTEPVRFTYFPHRHSEAVLDALKQVGFVRLHRYEGRVIDGAQYDRRSPADIKVIMVQTFEEMKRIYSLRREVFGGGEQVPDETIRLYLKDASGPNPRVRQFLAVDGLSGEALSQAGMSLFPDLKFSLLFAGGTLETARRRGAYTALVAARVAYARSIGIDHVGLFAREDTSAPIVARHGFEYCGEMQDWGRNLA